MPTGVAVVCDTDDCLAVYLAVETGNNGDERSADDVSQLARKTAEGDGCAQLRLRPASDDVPGRRGRPRPGPRARHLPAVHGPHRCGVQVRVLPALRAAGRRRLTATRSVTPEWGRR